MPSASAKIDLWISQPDFEVLYEGQEKSSLKFIRDIRARYNSRLRRSRVRPVLRSCDARLGRSTGTDWTRNSVSFLIHRLCVGLSVP